jgi:hypothetical protein
MFRLSKLALAAAAFFALSLAAANRTNAIPLIVADASGLGTTTTIDFQSQPHNTGSYVTSLTVAPVAFTYVGGGSSNNGVQVLQGTGTGVGGNGFDSTNNAMFVNSSAGLGVDTLQITFAPGTAVNAFGFDIKPSNHPTIDPLSLTPTGYRVTIVDDSGTNQFVVTPTDYNSFSFAGFTGSNITSISIATLDATFGQPYIDNFRYTAQAPASTPEPATMILFGTGLAGVASFARKRRSGRRDAEDATRV